MCVDNAGAHDSRNPATDRRLTMYWIGWVFFGITITSIFVAGVMVSMYKMNIQDSKARSSGDYYDDNTMSGDEEGASMNGGDLGTRRLQPTRKPFRRPPQRPHRGQYPPGSGGTLTYNVTTVHVRPSKPDLHEEDAPPERGHNPSTLVFEEEVLKAGNESTSQGS